MTSFTTMVRFNEKKMLYAYDDQKRVIATEYPNIQITNYSYSSTQIIETQKTLYPTPYTMSRTYTLDPLKRVIRKTSDSGLVINYTYNSQGYLIEEQFISGTDINFKIKYNYTNGNLTGTERDGRTVAISYGNEPVPANYLVPIDLDYPDQFTGPLKAYFGKLSKNLFTKVSNSVSPGYYSYSYEKDGSGNIINVLASFVSTSNTESKKITFSYDCK